MLGNLMNFKGTQTLVHAMSHKVSIYSLKEELNQKNKT
jgi:hypothetical protein